jgi:hypothetical protein
MGAERGVNLNKFKSYVVIIHWRALVFWSFCMNKTGESGPCNFLQICGKVSCFALIKKRGKEGRVATTTTVYVTPRPSNCLVCVVVVVGGAAAAAAQCYLGSV